jgi:hypothetical protein
MRTAIASIICASAGLFYVGCTAEVRGPEPVAEVGVGVDVDTGGPVFNDAGVVAIDVEPDPAQRVYVYDPGFPPGVYLYDNFYYYGGYRYPHDAFVNRYVQENIRQNRYTNVEDNRRQGQQIEQRQRTEFAKTGGKRTLANRTPANRTDVNRTDINNKTDINRTDVNRTERPANGVTTDHPDRTNIKPEERPAVNQPKAEDRPGATHEEHPAIKPDERTAEPREQHPAAAPKQDHATPEPRQTPAGERPAGTAGEKTDHEEQQK